MMHGTNLPPDHAMRDRTRTIVVVDDDPSVSKALVRLFRSAGLQAIAFNSCEDLFDYLTSASADLITLDLQMPDMHGLECIRKLKEGNGWSRIPVIVFTADANDQSRRAAMQLRVSEYIEKDSWLAHHLLALVKHHLGVE